MPLDDLHRFHVTDIKVLFSLIDSKFNKKLFYQCICPNVSFGTVDEIMTVSSDLVEHFNEPSLDATDETANYRDKTKIVSTKTDGTSTAEEKTVDETKIVSTKTNETSTDTI